MKFRLLVFLLILLKSLPSYAFQQDTVKLYYDINKKDIKGRNKTKLDSIARLISDTTTIHILGFADYLGKKAHNYTLSEGRAENVKNYLLSINSHLSNITADGKGQVGIRTKHSSALGAPMNRRVDIIITKAVIPVKIAIVPIKDSVVYKKPDDSVYVRISNLPNMDVGDSVSFNELTFLPGRHYLRSTAWPYMVAIKNTLKEHQNLKIEIQGHICCQYDNKDGLDYDSGKANLSLNRAKYIFDYLVSEGIQTERLSYKGLGSKNPKIYPEQTMEDQSQNRRVVIVILSK